LNFFFVYLLGLFFFSPKQILLILCLLLNSFKAVFSEHFFPTIFLDDPLFQEFINKTILRFFPFLRSFSKKIYSVELFLFGSFK
ncbi:UNVERIFIED_CONTAM: plasmid replication initiation protein, partial [Lacticaseibacillus paracasei]|nr:plasmid replication initiation protein [Lacticaseibacillus paracasei]